MSTSTTEPSVEKKGHICPPSKAEHPSDRWESLFVYSFICKFTQLRGKVEGFNTPMDFEEALLHPEPNPIMIQILSRFILNLRPQTRNLSSEVISTTMAGVLQEYFKSSERTVFWDDKLKSNVDPFQDMEGDFFSAPWDLKLKILRQLVELQLCHSTEIKNIIDRAWGVVHNKHKKNEAPPPPLPPTDPHSQERLQLLPLGQDKDRKRYWVVDDSPRLYMSTNPWKITAAFQSVSSTRDEYMEFVEKMRSTAPPEAKEGERRTKLEHAHLALLKVLQDRIEVVDAEIARIQRAKKKIEQRNLLIAQAEIRETRTRRRTTRPDYAYMNDPDSEEDQDEYTYQEQDDEEYDDRVAFDDLAEFREASTSNGRRVTAPVGRRRSTRTSNASSTGKRSAVDDEWGEWRGERRSTRLGTTVEPQLEVPPPRRARTEESTNSAHSGEGPVSNPTNAPGGGSGLKIKVKSAAAMKPTETAVETVAGKKKSKFWYYAVEPIAEPISGRKPPPANPPPLIVDDASSSSNGAGPGTANGNGDGQESVRINGSEHSSEIVMNTDMEVSEKSVESSSSPSHSMDES